MVAARFRSASLGVVGAYNTSNVGDLAMGWTIRRIAELRRAKPELQSLSSLDAYPRRSCTILGGGGLIHLHQPTSTLQLLLRHSPDKLAFVGVDGRIEPNECSEQVRSMLQRVAWIGVRNDVIREEMSAITDRSDIQVAPDVAFALASTLDAKGKPTGRHGDAPILGINVVPNLISVKGRSVQANSQSSPWFQKHFPEEAVVYGEIGQRYIELFRNVVEVYRSRGWTIRHIPFAVEDDVLARTVLANAGVEFVTYRANPVSVLAEVSTCTCMIASRFHAHVFALLSRTPVLSVAYAPKCGSLWSELALNREAQIRNLDLVRDPARALATLSEMEPAVLDEAVHQEVQRSARTAVDQALSALGIV